MGERGPKRKPVELELLHGNPGKRDLSNSIKFAKPDETPKPPMVLDKVAKKEWKRLAPVVFKMGILTEGDIAAFSAYCMAYSSWVAAEKQLQATLSENGGSLTFETDKGYVQQIPEVGIVNQARKHMISFAREFGLTPSARNGLSAAAAKTEDSEGSIMEFIKRRDMK